MVDASSSPAPAPSPAASTQSAQSPKPQPPPSNPAPTQTPSPSLPSPAGFFAKIEDLINKLPKIPRDLSNFPKWIPWVNLIIVILLLPLALAVFGIQAFRLPFLPFAEASQPGFTLNAILYNGLLFISLAVDIAALPGLFKRTLRGWKLVFLGTLIGGIFNIVNGSLFGLLFTVLWLRVLTQIKEHYRA